MQKIDIGKVAITLGGTWDANTSYERLTHVILDDDGCGYISLKDNIGIKPGTDVTAWQMATKAGKSIYELCVSHGTFVGTEDEFVAKYNAAVDGAETAAQRANEAAASATETEKAVSDNEDLRKAAESQRETNESQRKLNEDARVVAENGRVDAEQKRVDEFAKEKAAVEAAVSTTDTAATSANEAAEAANTAASNADAKATLANTAATKADEARKAIEEDAAVVKTSEQTLTDEQQEQARTNIGANTVNQSDAAIGRIVEALDRFGDVKCLSVSSKDIPMVCDKPLILYGSGVPSADVVPDNWDKTTMGEWTGVPTFIGQHYINVDASEGGEYYARGTSSVSDWRNK